MIEEWKNVPGYEGYYKVSNFGNVMSVGRMVRHPRGMLMYINGRHLHPQKSGLVGNQYLRVSLSKDNVQLLHFIHKLVAFAFIPNPNDHACVNHLDRNPFNNAVNNLEWVTTRENISYSTSSSYSKLKGAYWNKRDKKWRSAIFVDKRLKHLGDFSSEIEAANAYKKALQELNIQNKYAI